MSTNIPSIDVPAHLGPAVGDPVPGTRIYRRLGAQSEFQGWFDGVRDICLPEGILSPGGVGLYVQVSRTAVHKRIKEGGLTAFMFHLTASGSTGRHGGPDSEGGRPFTLIPVRECRAWVRMLNVRRGLDQPPEERPPRLAPAPPSEDPSWRQW